jgi:hypothetical protein
MTNPRFKPGDRVHYSSVIGEPPVSTHTVREVRVSGDWHDFPLYTLSDKPGCVAEAALSPAESEWPPGHAAEFKLREQLALAVRALEAVVSAAGLVGLAYHGIEEVAAIERCEDSARDALAQIRGETAAEPVPRTDGEWWVVRLEPGVWLDGAEGDPGRTCDAASAWRFSSRRLAEAALGQARTWRPFRGAIIAIIEECRRGLGA